MNRTQTVIALIVAAILIFGPQIYRKAISTDYVQFIIRTGCKPGTIVTDGGDGFSCETWTRPTGFLKNPRPIQKTL